VSHPRATTKPFEENLFQPLPWKRCRDVAPAGSRWAAVSSLDRRSVVVATSAKPRSHRGFPSRV